MRKISINTATPDWKALWTAAEAEERLSDFKFDGPGWYVEKDSSTLLVIPAGEHDIDDGLTTLGEPAWAPIWRKSWPPEQKFWFSIYNSRSPEEVLDLFNAIVNAPTREDRRRMEIDVTAHGQ